MHTQTLVITLTQEHTFRLVAPWHAHISHHTHMHIYKYTPYTHRNTHAFTTTHAHTHRDILMLACMRPHNLPAWMSPYTHTCMHAQNACMQGTLLHAHNTCTHMNARTDTAGTGLPSTLPRTSEEAEEEKVGTSFFSF